MFYGDTVVGCQESVMDCLHQFASVVKRYHVWIDDSEVGGSISSPRRHYFSPSPMRISSMPATPNSAASSRPSMNTTSIMAWVSSRTILAQLLDGDF
jgi:hypothetical protein